MRKTAITFGLLSGLIIILYSTAVFLTFGEFSKMSVSDFAIVEKLGYLRYIILALTIIFAINYFKKQNKGHDTFKSLFLAGLYTALIVALLVGLMELTYILINPGFFDQYEAIATAGMKEKGATASEITKQKEQIESYKWMANPAAIGIFYFLETFILGMIISAITAFIKRTRKGAIVMSTAM